MIFCWRLAACFVTTALLVRCSLEDPTTPFTDTSSQTPIPEGTTVSAAGSSPPTPPPTTPPASNDNGGNTPPPPSPTGSATIVDPLTNRTSVGEVSGGLFLQAGWQVTHRGNFIRYRVPTLTSGFVEWENLNLAPRNPAPDLFTIMGMWDPTRGDYRENPYRVHIRKLDMQGHNPPWVRLRFISNGDQHDVGYDFLEFVPTHPYRWRLEWGPGGSGNEARVYLDERLVIRTAYGPAYRPEEHWIEMGIEERAETIVGLVFRNVRIGPR